MQDLHFAHGDRCNRVINHLTRLVDQRNPKQIPVRKVHAGVEHPHALFDQDASRDPARLRLARHQDAGDTGVRLRKNLVGDSLRIEGRNHVAGVDQSRTPRNPAVAAADLGNHFHPCRQAGFESAVGPRCRQRVNARGAQPGCSLVRRSAQTVRFGLLFPQERHHGPSRLHDRIASPCLRHDTRVLHHSVHETSSQRRLVDCENSTSADCFLSSLSISTVKIAIRLKLSALWPVSPKLSHFFILKTLTSSL